MASKVDVDIKKLLEAGAHFGHKSSRWHPAMRPFIHSKRGDAHIIDLTKTVEGLETALQAITNAVAKGGKVLVVSTKRQAKEPVLQLAEDTGMPFVVNRWLGGMITNKKTMGERIKYLKKQEERMVTGELAAKFGKLEVQRFQEEIDDMNVLYGGIKDMGGNPAIIFVVDILHDKNAVAEATTLNIPVVGLVDTNGDPRTIKYPIPSNDDALKTINLICDYVKQAIELGKASRKAPKPEAEKPEVKAETAEQKIEAMKKEALNSEKMKTARKRPEPVASKKETEAENKPAPNSAKKEEK